MQLRAFMRPVSSPSRLKSTVSGLTGGSGRTKRDYTRSATLLSNTAKTQSEQGQNEKPIWRPDYTQPSTYSEGSGRHHVKRLPPQIGQASSQKWQAILTDKGAKVKRHSLKILTTAQQIRAARNYFRSLDLEVGLVPTMGALHEGHLSLMRKAAEENDVVIVSVFVNPAQFGPTEDLATYPKTWKEDERKIRQLNNSLQKDGSRGCIRAVFRPDVSSMYPGVKKGEPLPLDMSYVTVNPSLTGVLEGAARPTFFRGVTTVVMKLFWLILPDRAYFGQKDVQQLVVINRMVRDFQIPIRVVSVDISRDPTELALSSRNAYLGERRRKVATVLNRALRAAELAMQEGRKSRDEVLGAAMEVAASELKSQRALPPHLRALFEVEYISMADYRDLVEVEDGKLPKKVVLSGTIKMLPLESTSDVEILGLGEDKKPVRLLDNIIWRNLRHPETEKTGKDVLLAEDADGSDQSKQD